MTTVKALRNLALIVAVAAAGTASLVTVPALSGTTDSARVSAGPPTTASPVSQSFRGASVVPLGELHSRRSTATPTPPKPEQTVGTAATTARSPRPVPSGSHASAWQTLTATWYCGHGSRCTAGYPGGLYAAISPDLASWTGRLVRVCYGASCVVVRVIDCLCSRMGGIDLYSAAFEQLAPLSLGEIVVTVTVLP